MIKYHVDRNIEAREVPGILFNQDKLQDLVEEKYRSKPVLTNYGRTAFRIICETYDLKDCKVMLPAFICGVFSDIFKEMRIEPVFIDVDKRTFNISVETLRKGYDSQAKALIVNNMNGLPCDVEGLKKVLNKNQLLIEDCAHSLGARHNNQLVGTFGDASFFSLYKPFPCVSGAFALFNNLISSSKLHFNIGILEKDRLPKALSLIYYLGKTGNFIKNFKGKDNYEQDVYEQVETRGINLVSERIAGYYFKKMNKIIQRRREIARFWNKVLEEKVELQEDKLNEHIYTYYSFLLPRGLNRQRFIDNLRKKGIIARVIWNLPYGNTPVTWEISQRIVGVPINPNYTDEDVEFIAQALYESLEVLDR